VVFEGAPRFHEFVVELPAGAEETNASLLEQKIIGGLPLAKWYPEMGPNASLWCATEMTTRKQMDAAADALRAVVPAAELTRA
jgi:glycine dehydrogenase subunit 1